MADAKIEIKVGGVSFAGEGSENWLSSELDKLIKHLPELIKVAPVAGGGSELPANGAKKVQGTPAAFLTAKGAKTSQVRKFLATALWLQDTEGKQGLQPPMFRRL